MKTGFLVYEGLAALDAIGPYEVLSSLPDRDIVIIGPERGLVRTGSGPLGLSADVSIDDVDALDILVVPGGSEGTRRLTKDERVLDWVRRIHETTTWTTSVCTGSLILAAAGVLDGVRATTHWASMDELGALGAIPTDERVIVEGKIVTAAGVSSGIDMALTLVSLFAGDVVAQAVQLGIEYDPQPPFDAGSVHKAPAEVVDLVRSVLADRPSPVL